MLFSNEQLERILTFISKSDLAGFWTILGIIIAGGFTLIATTFQNRYDKKRIKRNLKPDLKKYLLMYSRTKRIAINVTNKERFHAIKASEIWAELNSIETIDVRRNELLRQHAIYNDTINDLSNQINEQIVNAIKYQGEIVSILTNIETYYKLSTAKNVNGVIVPFINNPIIVMYYDYTAMMDNGMKIQANEFIKEQDLVTLQEANSLTNVLLELDEYI